MFGWKAAIPVWAAPTLSHLSLFLAITRKTQWQKSCATSSQLWNCLWKALAWILCTFLGWEPPWLQEFRGHTHTHTQSGQCHIQGVWDKAGAGGASTALRVCLSWCPGVPKPCPAWHCHSPSLHRVGDAVLGSQPFISHRRAGRAQLAQEQHLRAQTPLLWVGRNASHPPGGIPASAHPPPPASTAQTSPSITTPAIPVFLSNRQL